MNGTTDKKWNTRKNYTIDARKQKLTVIFQEAKETERIKVVHGIVCHFLLLLVCFKGFLDLSICMVDCFEVVFVAIILILTDDLADFSATTKNIFFCSSSRSVRNELNSATLVVN